MNKTRKKTGLRRIGFAAAGLFLAFIITAMPIMASTELSSKEALEAIAESMETDTAGLISSDQISPGEAISDWIVFALIRDGFSDGAREYTDRLKEYVSQAYQKNGGLDNIRSTEWARTVMLVTALGADAAAFGKDADGNDINLLNDGIYNWTKTDSLGAQGINGWLYALLALDCGAYDIPEDAKYTREIIILNLLDGQSENGAFSLQKGGSDVDITAMVLTSLAPYKDSSEEYVLSDGSVTTVPQTIEKALAWLSETQEENGGFSLEGLNNAESVSQVIIALASLGIDPEKDERFIKSGNTPLDALAGFKTDEYMFSHEAGGKADLLASEQAAIAVSALEYFRADKGRIYDLTNEDVGPETSEENTKETVSCFLRLADSIMTLRFINGI